MLFANPEFDLVSFITPSDNPVTRAQKILHKRFPNIAESAFDEKSVANILGVDEWMDLRPYMDMDLPEVKKSIASLDGKVFHPLAQSASNYLAFITNSMDCFIKACEGLKDKLGFTENFSIGSQGQLAKLYYSNWLEPMTALLSSLASSTMDDKSHAVDNVALNSLYRSLELFCDKAESLLRGNYEAFSVYYDENYGGQFYKELTELKSYLSFELGYTFHYTEMLIHAQKEGFLLYTLNPALSTKDDADNYSKDLCYTMKERFDVNVRSGKANDICSELIGFKAGYQQMKGNIFNGKKPFSLLSPPAETLRKATEQFSQRELPQSVADSQNQSLFSCHLDGADMWRVLFESSSRKGIQDFVVKENAVDGFEPVMSTFNWISDAASAWRCYFEMGQPKEVREFLSETARVTMASIATMTATKNQQK